MLVILVVFCAATARLIIWPAQGMPAHVDAIVVLGGYGNRLGTGIDLWHQGRAPVLVVSRGVGIPVPASVCSWHGQTVKGICFNPMPGTTQGEAEAVGRLAKQYRWRSIVLVTSPDQDTRARSGSSAVSPVASTWSPLLCPHPNGHMRSPISGLLSSRNSYCSQAADRTTFAEVPAGFGVGTTTAWRYVNETRRVARRRPPKLRKAVRDAEQGSGHSRMLRRS